MKIYNYLGILLLSLFSFSAIAQVPAPGEEQKQPIAIMNAYAHLGNGEVIENSVVTFADGIITNVGDATTIRIDLSKFKVIDAEGMHIYPGLIASNTIIGLEEIAAVRATRDQDETGEFNPNVRALIAYNTDSEIIPTTRFNGVLYAQTTPRGGRISGSSSVMDLDAWNWEDAVLKNDEGIHLNWPSKLRYPRWWLGETEWRENEDYDKEYEEVKGFFKDAVSYKEISNPETTNLKLEAMKGLFDGSKSLYIHTDRAKEILQSIQFALEMGVKKVVLVGGDEAYYVKDFLKENEIPVILEETLRLPSRTADPVDMPYQLPNLLHKAGIKVAIGQWGEVMQVRNLPFSVGTAAAYGLGKEEALKMVTLNAAEIMGVDDKIGSLEKGKIASIVVSKGDILDMDGNQPEYVFIEGRQVTLDAHQQRLYKKFKDKYED
ncbi:imidazolonepropionase [Marivirga tractuosa]|uniref:Amidohydrolase n=1 Tax=Marivirga tractuosa (strain ATCC 23168 / DSM 4126 / NBRC 15989 / NCIMB 1408 / VKM B-1430 / H-43) TaxID=643867 RepID=E4TQQ2_MARTH|nr:amidohydrolase family protein [Marivirga tractuosa]ADR20613.1 amidohydrolase [Marivirga tractuosa DSM 4126]BDD14937.1 imidazolonepropionase [Marivirga tractuosa]